MLDHVRLEEALEALGALLESRDHNAELVVIGGGSLLMLGLISRPTKDLDVVAVVEGGALRRGEPLPEPVVAGPRSKHFADLLRLAPSADELAVAAEWCRGHDPSDGFATMLDQALTELERRRED